MNIFDVNQNTLANLYVQYPESFKDLKLDGNNLVYNNMSVNISEFNINDLFSDTTNFASSLSILSSEDIFRIIRLHALTLNSRNLNNKFKSKTEKKLEIIKRDNPLLKNVTIVTKDNNGNHDEYINIVGSDGVDKTFKNDRNVDIFEIYDLLRMKKNDVTPDELIDAIERKLHEVKMDNARDIVDSDETSMDFENKISSVNGPYKTNRDVSVMGNEEEDIAVVSNSVDPDKHEVVTFRKDEFGDLITDSHTNNVESIETSVRSGNEETFVKRDDNVKEKEKEEKKENIDSEVVSLLIPLQEFYDLLNNEFELSESQVDSINLYYAYFGDLVLYEDYLLPELKNILNQFRSYVYELEYGSLSGKVNGKQQTAINKHYEMEDKAKTDDSGLVNENENVKKLALTAGSTNMTANPYNNDNEDNSGSISTLQVIIFIVGTAIILTALTVYLLQ